MHPVRRCVLLLLLSAACSSSAGSSGPTAGAGRQLATDAVTAPLPGSDAEPAFTDRAWDGPQVDVELETSSEQPAEHALVVRVNCPTGGWALGFVDRRGEPGLIRILLSLTAPGRDELVTQAFVEHSIRVELGGDSDPLQLWMERRVRGERPARREFVRVASLPGR